jgi:trk system potassium uptake protein TrkH
MSVLWLVLAMFMTLPLIVLVIENDPDAPAFAVSLMIILSATFLTWALTPVSYTHLTLPTTPYV